MAPGILCSTLSILLVSLIALKFPEVAGAPEPNVMRQPPCSPCPDGIGIGPPLTGLAPTTQLYCPPCVIVSQSCSKGYYLEGKQCVQCPCRVPGSYCQKNPGAEVVCICPEGYIGRFCETCAPGFVQQNFYPYACAKPVPDRLPPGCIDGPNIQWPNCTVAPPWPGNPCPPCPFQPNCPPCPYQPPQPTCPPCVFNPVVGPDYCPPCQPGPVIRPTVPPPQCPYPPCPPPPIPTTFRPPIIYPPPPPIDCPITPICPRPPPAPVPPPCPLPMVCPVQVPPTISCPYMPVCPIPLPTPPPQPCPVTPICPIPIPECNVTCDCNCPGSPSSPITCPVCPPCQCDPRGTLIQNEKECLCKANVEGALCDNCKPGYFGLRSSNSKGCLKCFCSGVSESCTFAPFYKGVSVCTVTSDVQLIDSEGNYYVMNRGTPVSYNFPGRGSPLLFWVLPRKTFDNRDDLCSGNLLKSYGMTLTVGLQYSLSSSSPSVPGNDIIIVGTDHFTIYWTSKQSFSVGDITLKAVLDENDGWLVAENGRSRLATREDILFVLANVDKILLRATFADGMRSTTLRNVLLEQGTLTSPRQSDFTLQIEDCACPIGYAGHSCQSCAPNFYRDTKDMSHSVFGRCKRCPCRDPNAKCELGSDGNVICSDCIVNDSVSLTLKPLRVSCCEDEEIEFICTYESTKRLEIELYTIPNLQFPRRESSNGISARIKLKSQLQKVVCSVKDNIQGSKVVIVEASSYLDVKNCNVSLPSPPPLVYVNATIVPEGKFKCYDLGETIHFNCSAWVFASRLPNLAMVWSRPGGKTIRRDPYARPQSSGELLIRNAEFSDSGTYFCSISHSTVLQLDRVVILVYNKSKGVCPRCNEIPLPFREQDDAPMKPWMQELVLDEQHLVVVESVVASNASRTLPLLTTTAAPKRGLAPNVSIEPSIMNANVGDMVQLHCKILEGTRDNVSVFWRKKDGSSDLAIGVKNSSTLTFGPVTKQHEGEYHCIVTNAFGKGGDKAILIVNEKDPVSPNSIPEKALQTDDDDIGVVITIKPPGHLVKPGGKVELHCKPKRNENLKIEWLKENGIIRKTANIESNGQLLVLPAVVPDDSGWYVCAGSSPAGDIVSTKIKIVVKAESIAPTVSISEPSPLVVRGGRKVRLECQAYGEPTPILSWSRFVTTSEGMEEQTLLETQASTIAFEIRHAVKDHEGEYFCTGKNDAGEDRVSMLLKVNDAFQCTSHQFRCLSGDQCITLDDRCDGEKDCRDGSDERHCHHHHYN